MTRRPVKQNNLLGSKQVVMNMALKAYLVNKCKVQGITYS